MTFEFDKKKRIAAEKAIENLCYHCEKHSDDCRIAVALGELRQEYAEKKRPEVNYNGFDFDANKSKEVLSKVEEMCWHCEKHSDDCPITKIAAILQHYAK